jgi:predicted nucleotidyltransferase component of viral defense system
MFAVPEVAGLLAFRGGTALYKLHLRPPARYSEDIDLVQIDPGPIGPALDAIRRALDPWLGSPKRTTREGRVVLLYRMSSEGQPSIPMRLKIEINSREHFTEHGHLSLPFEVRSEWWSGTAGITTFTLDELLGTKLRALYQRRKGRDLFDLWYALSHGQASADRIVVCFERYLREEGHRVARAVLEENVAKKLTDRQFRADMTGLLRPGIEWDIDDAGRFVMEHLLAKLPGESWKRP